MNAKTRSRCRRSGVVLTAMVLLVVAATPVSAAGPRYWDWPAGRSLDEVTLTAAGLDTLGGLTNGPSVRIQALSGPEVAWRVVGDGDGGWYLGTGHGGEIHHVKSDGATHLVARLGSTAVFSLLLLPGGDLLAGGGPDGRLARVTAAGDVTEVGRIEGSCIWAMVADPKAAIAWLATGAPSAVYRYDWRVGKLERCAELPAQNTMDLALEANGDLLAVTQGPGLVYRLPGDGTGRPWLVGEIPQDEARRLLRGPGGEIHVLGLAGGQQAAGGTTDAVGGNASLSGAASRTGGGAAGAAEPAAALYRLRGDNELVRVWAGARELMAAAWSPRWGWIGAGTLGDGSSAGGVAGLGAVIEAGVVGNDTETVMPRDDARATVFRLVDAWGVQPLTSWVGGDVLDIVPFGEDGFAMAQAHPAALGLGWAGDGPGLAVSPPLDGGVSVRWRRLRWEGVPGDGAARWSVRGGRRAEPDRDWTPWSQAWTEADHPLDLEGCRYLQWRVELPAARAGARPWRVTGVSVSAWQPNLPPIIEEFRLEELRGVRLGGVNGGESIVHEYRSGLRAEFTQQDPPEQGWSAIERADRGRAVRVVTWRASDPNGDSLEYELECRHEGEAAWRPASAPGSAGGATPLTGSLGSWDTTGLVDGRYELRLVASDGPDNPGTAAASAARQLGPLVVDNTPPRLTDLELRAVEGGLRLRFRAGDDTSPLAGARVILPDGAAERLDPADGICDSTAESFDLTILWPRAPRAEGDRPWRVRVEVRDLAGNIAGAEAVAP